jgi:hypothetical protein
MWFKPCPGKRLGGMGRSARLQGHGMARNLWADLGWRSTEASCAQFAAFTATFQRMGNLTTVGIKGFPRQLAAEDILNTINRQYQGGFNFFYAAMDPQTGDNDGIALINFRSTSQAHQFKNNFQGRIPWGHGESEEINTWCSTFWAVNQGTEMNMDQYDAAKYFKAYIPDGFRPWLIGQDGRRKPNRQFFACLQQTYSPKAPRPGWRPTRQASVTPTRPTCPRTGHQEGTEPGNCLIHKCEALAIGTGRATRGATRRVYRCPSCATTFQKWHPCLLHMGNAIQCHNTIKADHGKICNSTALQELCAVERPSEEV